MCQATVYLRKDGTEKEILRDVIFVEPVAEGVKIQTFFKAPEFIEADIVSIDLLKHRIILTAKE